MERAVAAMLGAAGSAPAPLRTRVEASVTDVSRALATRGGSPAALVIAAAQRLVAEVLAHAIEDPVDGELARAAGGVYNAALHHPERPMRIREIVQRAPPEIPLLVGTRDRPLTKIVQRTRFAYTEVLTTMSGGAPLRRDPDEAPITEREGAARLDARKNADDETSARPPRPPVRLAETLPAIAPGQLYEIAVDHCANLLTMLGRHRAEAAWSARGEQEARILEQVDALCATGGDVVKRIATWWSPVRPSPDPWRTWAAVFALAALDGPDAMDAIGRGLERLPADAHDAGCVAAEALVATSHPQQEILLRDLLVSPHPLTRAVAIDVLSRRGAMSAGELRPHLMDVEPAVLVAALESLPRLEPQAGGMLAWTLRLMQYPDARVAWVAVRTAFRWRRPEPIFDLRRGGRLRETLAPEDALEILVLGGAHEDFALAEEILSSMRITPRALLAIGRFGHAAAVPLLLDLLGDPDLGEPAAAALVRMLGPRVPEREATNPEAWRAAVAALRPEADVRYQEGEAWRPEALVADCVRGEHPRREIAARLDELATRTGQGADIDLRLWSSEIAGALEQHLAHGRFSHGWRAGSWEALGLRG